MAYYESMTIRTWVFLIIITYNRTQYEHSMIISQEYHFRDTQFRQKTWCLNLVQAGRIWSGHIRSVSLQARSCDSQDVEENANTHSANITWSYQRGITSFTRISLRGHKIQILWTQYRQYLTISQKYPFNWESLHNYTDTIHSER